MAGYSLHTLWIWRKEEDGPGLAVAWDDYDVTENPDGYEAAKKQALQEVGGEVWQWRDIVIRVDFERIEQSFHPPEIKGDVGEPYDLPEGTKLSKTADQGWVVVEGDRPDAAAEVCRWLISLDEAANATERRSMTLGEIIERARRAVA